MPSGGSKNKKQDPLVQILLERTETWGKKYEMYLKGKEPKSKVTKTAKDIDKVIKTANFGCQEDAVRSICNILLKKLGESNLPKRKGTNTEVTYLPGIVLVPTSGDYIGEPALVINKHGKNVSTEGNKVKELNFSRNADTLRLAEEIEIEHLLNILRKNYPDRHEFITLLVEGF